MDIEETLRRSHGDTCHHDVSSPEFEFWMVGNHPELECGNQLTADELFVDGVLLPLDLLSFANHEPEPEPLPPPLNSSSSSSSIASAPITSSKRWKDIFKVREKKPAAEEKEKSNRRERRVHSGGTELNINIWPFSRSWSAGTAGGRPKAAGKSSSAPCSRSNSCSETQWAASPRRAAGVHVGRASPVRQVRRAGRMAQAKVGPKGKAGGAWGMNLAPLNGCIGYRGQVSCREEEHDGGNGSTNGRLSRFRGLFTKKVY